MNKSRPASTVCCAGLGGALVLCVASAIIFTALPHQLLPWNQSLQHTETPNSQMPDRTSLEGSNKASGGAADAVVQAADAVVQAAGHNRSFSIQNDMFIKDGLPFRIISGSVHYHRIPPDLWHDRLQRVRALGLNAIQLYVPWNFHQPRPGPEGILPWQGWQDLPRFIALAADLGLLVLLRPGPYICAEWEFGGFPAWLLEASSSSSSSSGMVLRSSDPAYLAAVDGWWGVLLSSLAHLTYDKGGPIIMVQLENEYGYYGGDKAYLTHLRDLVRQHMGEQVLLYSVDGASALPLAMGSLPGSDVLATVDFGPTTDVAAAFQLQKRFNPPGKSPPFCVEYYTGWLTHWGEPMAKTAATDMAKTLSDILAYANGTASVNLYMAAGGTNFGPWAGANVLQSLLSDRQQQQQPGPGQWRLQQYSRTAQQQQQRYSSSSSGSNSELYAPHITSYDYSCPVGEAGSVGQVGVGGDSKFDAIRAVVAAAQGSTVDALPQLPPPVAVKAYEPVVFSEGLYVLDALEHLSSSCRNSSYCSKQLAESAPAGARHQQHGHNTRHHHPHQHSPKHYTTSTGSSSKDIQQMQHTQQQQQWWRSWSAVRQQLLNMLHGSSGSNIPSSGASAAPQVSSALKRIMLQQHSHAAVASQQQTGAAAAPAATPSTSPSSSSSSSSVVSHSSFPMPMEQYGQYYGLIVYETQLSGAQSAAAGGPLQFQGHDTVWVFVDGQLLGRSYRSAPATIVVPPSPFAKDNSSTTGDSSISSNAVGSSNKNLLHDAASGAAAAAAAEYSGTDALGKHHGSSSNGRALQLVVWPMGRNNFGLFGQSMADSKGLIGNVTLGGTVLTGWTVHHLCMSGGAMDSFANLHLPWRPLAPTGAAVEAAGAGMAWKHSSSSGSRRANDSDQRAGASAVESAAETSSSVQHGDQPVLPLVLPASMLLSSPEQQAGPSSSSGDAGVGGSIAAHAGNITAFITTVAEAQAQAVIAAAADAASGSGPATAAARAAANIRAGIALTTAKDASMNVAPGGRGPLLLRGSLHVPAASHARASTAPARQQQQQQGETSVHASRPGDTFLHLGNGWGRGEVWVNGHSLGRYWSDQGPQMSLYLPGSFIQEGLNEVVLLELDGRVPIVQGQPLSIKCEVKPDFAGPAAGPAPL